MQNTIYHWIPVSVLAEITKQSPRRLKKLYRKIIQDDCVPLNDIGILLYRKIENEFKTRFRGNVYEQRNN